MTLTPDIVLMVLVTAGGFAFLVIILLFVVARAAGRSAHATAPLTSQMEYLNQRVQTIGDGQQQLAGGLTHVSEAQAAQQSNMIKLMEARLAAVQEQMTLNLTTSAKSTASSLGELQQRLVTIDKAQDNIQKLSGDVLSLQDILSNKQTRGAFGEIQLQEIVSKALPSDAYAWQVTLSNGKRADCLIHLPNPPGPIVIDSKFPLEAYEALRNAKTDWEANEAAKFMRSSVKAHIKAISEKYILDGETADGALMFLPSEAVYAELHSNFPELVRDGFEARVWIVSPTTCMATLNTMRAILKDARMREQAGAIRTALRLLHRDVELVVDRVDKLNTHFNQARKDIEGITTAAERAGKRAHKLDNFDFEEIEAAETVAPLTKP
ncbi:MAG: DNA recombination protein RmuC [Planktomarina sp.]|jgi:DNA recombination protein RmuC|nr:DNA recombination protein RmuC [Planktomarina sp.]MDT2056967.1 DNA recombination protein RmuC [Planktomarina sp.]MDT2072094.1 DNA recombination protein RmuC [Planktomarina sp.]MDT2077095.1 DNA recombination protein RmuC [Planktomarina sp.]HAJ83654.1 DNA recombination protein RmuC [Paracoccaceae bacterium]|tara:strand:+ start:27262 stop:28401 length:1140 start_codon:yes stop_codon:yes gene_type:complete